jgi:hypothetical protein
MKKVSHAHARARRMTAHALARALLGCSIVLAIGVASGTAYAFVGSSGGGSGGARVGSTHSVVVTAATGTVTNQLSPGGSGDLVLTLDDPNPGSLTLVALQQHGSVTVVGGQDCTAANAGVSAPSLTGLSLGIGSGTHSVTVPHGALMSTASASGCQGASFQIPVLVTVDKG